MFTDIQNKNFSIEEIKQNDLLKVSEEFILEKWRANSNSIQVYVENPFCLQQCKYCAYKGRALDREAFSNYYFHYLPKQIKTFSSIIESNNIHCFNFGGGTPNVMDLRTAKMIFDMIPKLKESDKIIEVHLALLSKEFIDLLADYKFTTISLGIQSFDATILKRENRIIDTLDSASNLTNYIKSKNMQVSIDLLMYIRSFSDQELYIGIQDLIKALSLEPDEVNMAFNYERFNNIEEYWKWRRKTEEIFSEIKKKTGYYCYEIDDCFLSGNKPTNFNLKRNTCNFRFYRKPIDIKEKFEEMGPINMYDADYAIPTLALGSFNRIHPIVSTIHNYQYLEYNNNWKPEYYEFFSDRINKLEEIRQYV